MFVPFQKETELRYNDITLMVPSGNSYQVLRLLLYSAVDVGRARTMQWIGGLYDFCRSDRSDDASQAKIVYALETDEEGKERGMEGFMKLQIGYISIFFFGSSAFFGFYDIMTPIT